MKIKRKPTIAILGLGYVGLPLAIEFSKKFLVIGFDITKNRISQLKKNYDINNEISKKQILLAKNIKFTNIENDIANADVYIVTVPTPLKKNNLPDLSLIKKSCEQIAKYLSKKNIVVFESTVYPGTTDELCIPILEKNSNLKCNRDFYCGYSPERINPGDKKHGIKSVVKIVSGSNKVATKKINDLYKNICVLGTFTTSSII